MESYNNKKVMPIYCKNKDLYNELIKCKDASINASKELTAMFYMIAEKFSTKFTYKFEDDRNDCIQQAVMDCFMYSHNFDGSKYKNAFGYITQIVKNGFYKSWKKTHPLTEFQQISIDRNNLFTL